MPDDTPPECRRCQIAMQRGFVLETYDMSNPRWIAGEPESGFAVVLKTRRRPKLDIVTYRCPKCGLLESYATSA